MSSKGRFCFVLVNIVLSRSLLTVRCHEMLDKICYLDFFFHFNMFILFSWNYSVQFDSWIAYLNSVFLSHSVLFCTCLKIQEISVRGRELSGYERCIFFTVITKLKHGIYVDRGIFEHRHLEMSWQNLPFTVFEIM